MERLALTLEKAAPDMNLEIQKPELVQRVNAHIRTGHFHDADEVLESALDARTFPNGSERSLVMKSTKTAYYGSGNIEKLNIIDWMK